MGGKGREKRMKIMMKMKMRKVIKNSSQNNQLKEAVKWLKMREVKRTEEKKKIGIIIFVHLMRMAKA